MRLFDWPSVTRVQGARAASGLQKISPQSRCLPGTYAAVFWLICTATSINPANIPILAPMDIQLLIFVEFISPPAVDEPGEYTWASALFSRVSLSCPFVCRTVGLRATSHLEIGSSRGLIGLFAHEPSGGIASLVYRRELLGLSLTASQTAPSAPQPACSPDSSPSPTSASHSAPGTD